MTVAPILIPLADAVVAELNSPVGHTFSKSFVAQRTYNTEQKLEDGEALQVFVVPGRSPFELSSRAGLQSNRDIAIFVRQKMNVDETAKVDANVAFLEELNTYFAERGGDGLEGFDAVSGGAHYLSSEITPFFPTRLRSQREYLGVLIVTFRVYEDEG